MDPQYEQFLKIIACNKCMTNKKIVMNVPCGCIQSCAYCHYKQMLMTFSEHLIRLKNRQQGVKKSKKSRKRLKTDYEFIQKKLQQLQEVEE